MRIHILSDLHTEFDPYIPDPAADGADVVVLAGDIGLRARGVEWARQAFRVPTFYVPGAYSDERDRAHR
jgi:predicted phosphodiesterase